MLSAFFMSGAVVGVGLLVLGVEACWLYRTTNDVPWALLLAGAALLVALLAALRAWPWPWLALTLTFGLIGHLIDLRERRSTR